MKTKLFTLIAALFISTIGMNQIIHVPEDESSIQSGINAADDGDTVLVAHGHYYENISFEGKAITVASQYLLEADSSHIYSTIIDGGDPTFPNDGSVVYFVSGEDTTSVLCGFTIQNGTGTYPDSWGDRSGGGIFCEYSGAKIIHNRIINNSVTNDASGSYGAGVVAGSEATGFTMILKNNYIAYNELNSLGNTYIASGGGVFVYGLNHIIHNNNIEYNTAIGRWARGAGLTTTNSVGIVSNNEIRYNEIDVTFATGVGGGIHLSDPGPGLTITQNTIEWNTCIGNGNYHGGGIGVINWGENGDYYIDGNSIVKNDAMWGGGIFLAVSVTGCKITNNLIRDNQAEEWGGGIYCFNSYATAEEQSRTYGTREKRTSKKRIRSSKDDALPQLINNTIINNTAGTSGGGIFNSYEENDLVVFNNILVGNEADVGAAVYNEFEISTTFLYNNNIDTDLIQGNWSGTNNIFVDPQFKDDGYHLSEESECKDVGCNSIDIDNEEYNCPYKDIDGEDRPSSNGVDIGADEWYPVTDVEKYIALDIISLQNFPNPFTLNTTVFFNLESETYADISVFDLSGKKVITLLSKNLSSGKHEVEFDGQLLEKGIYFCTLKTNSNYPAQTIKIIKL